MPELYNYTVQKVCNDVRLLMSDTAGIRFRDATVIGWINDAQRDVAIQTNFLQKSISLPLLAGQSTYNLAQLLAGQRFINFGSVLAYGTKLEQITNEEYLRRIAQYDTPNPSVGQPVICSEFSDQLNLWPVPNQSVAGALVIYGTAAPDDVSSVDDLLTVPDRLYDALLRGVMAKALEFDERPDEAANAIVQRDAAIQREHARASRNPDDQNPVINWGYENDDYPWMGVY